MFKNKGNQFHSKSKYYNIQQSNYMKKKLQNHRVAWCNQKCFQATEIKIGLTILFLLKRS